MCDVKPNSVQQGQKPGILSSHFGSRSVGEPRQMSLCVGSSAPELGRPQSWGPKPECEL